MVERIEGLSIELDLNILQLQRGLKGLKDRFKTVNSELNTTLSAFDKGEKSIEKYEATLNGLNKKLELQKRIVSESRVEYEKMANEHGEGSKKAEEAARSYNNQAAKLNKLQSSVQRTEASLFDMKEEQRLASNGWSKLGDEAEKAGNRIIGIGDRMRGIGQNMSLAFTAPILGGFAAVTKGTEEFRGDMARLETNAEQAGVGIDTVRTAMERLSGVSDETDSNVEALSNLLATDLSENGMITAMDALSGAAIKFSDTLKIEGLADGLQETLATGSAIGPFAELLERSSINLDSFNSGLQSAIKNGTEEQYILKTLADTGLADVNEAYRKNNKELVESREASARFQQSTAELGKVLTPVATTITNGLTSVVDKFNNLDESGKRTVLIFTAIIAAMGPLITFGAMFTTLLGNIVKGIAPVLSNISKAGGLINALRIGFAALTGPVGITIAIITALGIGFTALYKNSETFRNGISSLGSKLKEIGENALNFLKPAVESVKNFFLVS